MSAETPNPNLPPLTLEEIARGDPRTPAERAAILREFLDRKRHIAERLGALVRAGVCDAEFTSVEDLWRRYRFELHEPCYAPPPPPMMPEGAHATAAGCDVLLRHLEVLFPSMPTPDSITPATDPESGDGQSETPKRRPCYDRDHTFLRWAEEEGLKPAAIRDRWNREHPEEKVGTGESGRDVVKKGLTNARAEQNPG